MGIVLLVIALIMGVAVFKIGSDAGWHWGGGIAAALVPIGFTFFLGILGLIIGGFFVAAVWKANG